MPSDLDVIAELLAVDRQDIDVLAGWLRDDGCPEDRLPLVINKILNPNHERTVPEFWTGAPVDDDDDRFRPHRSDATRGSGPSLNPTVRRQPPGWSR